MAAPARAALRGFNCQDMVKFTLLFGLMLIAGLVVTGFIDLRDIQDRIGWIPSNETLNTENKVLRGKVLTLKIEKIDLENRLQKVEAKLQTTTDEKNDLLVDATICANSSWLSWIVAMCFGVFLRYFINFFCYCYLQRRYRERGVAVAYQN